MAVQMCNVEILNNPASVTEEFQFQITFESIESLEDDVEWKVVYVGSSENEYYDQELDSILVGPITPGRHKFNFTADPPDFRKIPEKDVVGVTVIFISCCFKSQEFERVGYYLNNAYIDEELRENPPEKPILEKLQRNMLASDPRVTRFEIKWGNEDPLDERNECDPIREDDVGLTSNDVDELDCPMIDHGSSESFPDMEREIKPGVFAITTDSVDLMQ